MKKWIATLFLIALTGCATHGSVDTGITLLEGRHIDVATTYFGLPNDKYDLNGQDVYVWKHEGIGTHNDAPLTTYGGFGSRGGFGGVGIVLGAPDANRYSYSCVIKALANQEQIIQKIEYNRTRGGCTQYNEAIKKMGNDLMAGQ